MKINYKGIFIGTGAMLALTACNDLDTNLYGDEVTTQTKEEVLDVNPDMAQAGVNAIASGAYQAFNVSGDSDHADFGLPSIMMMLDSNGQDFISPYIGYNWYMNEIGLNCGNYTGSETLEIWSTMYSSIKTENSVLSTIPEDTEDEDLMFYRAQALCFRAFDYWLLSQVYQQNYEGNETKPCVPIITEQNQEEAAVNGCARSSVQEVYDRILSDLNEAIELLSNTPVTAQSVMSSKPKRFFNLDTAYGMLARVCLTMHDYQGALDAAQKCLAVTTCRPYSISEVNHPTFISLEDPSWLWGQPVAESDIPVLTGIVNFPSMMGTFNYGYAQAGAWKWINKNLYDYIPNSDVRKGWWLDSNFQSPNLSADYYSYLENYGFTNDPDSGQGIMAYTQVKYAPYNYVIDTENNASDIPYFRIEEVYYIMYEAMAMTGKTGDALSGLQQFVRTYRNPGYSFSSTSAQEIQDEIWMQRRVEFWGEGFVAWFDLKRLNKGIDRVGAGYPSVWVYQIGAGAESFVLPIPQSETTTNKLLPQSENNPNWAAPSAI